MASAPLNSARRSVEGDRPIEGLVEEGTNAEVAARRDARMASFMVGYEEQDVILITAVGRCKEAGCLAVQRDRESRWPIRVSICPVTYAFPLPATPPPPRPRRFPLLSALAQPTHSSAPLPFGRYVHVAILALGLRRKAVERLHVDWSVYVSYLCPDRRILSLPSRPWLRQSTRTHALTKISLTFSLPVLILRLGLDSRCNNGLHDNVTTDCLCLDLYICSFPGILLDCV